MGTNLGYRVLSELYVSKLLFKRSFPFTMVVRSSDEAGDSVLVATGRELESFRSLEGDFFIHFTQKLGQQQEEYKAYLRMHEKCFTSNVHVRPREKHLEHEPPHPVWPG